VGLAAVRGENPDLFSFEERSNSSGGTARQRENQVRVKVAKLGIVRLPRMLLFRRYRQPGLLMK